MLLKITLVAIVTNFARAQPFYSTYSPAFVNIIACSTDADCLNQTPPQGAGFNCYTATYMQARSPVLTGGFVVSTSALCLPEDFAEYYSPNPIVIQESSTKKLYDTWLFKRITAPTTPVVPMKAC